MFHLLVSQGIFLLDRVCKNQIEAMPKEKLPKELLHGAVTLDYSKNKGMMLNLGEKNPKLVKGLSGSAFAVLTFFYIRLLLRKGLFLTKLGFSFMVGGALSNVYDHLKKGYVVDYIRFPLKPIRHIVFNIGDLFLFAGAFFLMIRELFRR